MTTWQEQISDPAGLGIDHGEGENAAMTDVPGEVEPSCPACTRPDDPDGTTVAYGMHAPAACPRRAAVAEAASINHLVQLDQWHRDLGHVMCAGVCSRWYEPDQLDDFGSCRALDCQRAAVNP